jgi:hypothetical protein
MIIVEPYIRCNEFNKSSIDWSCFVTYIQLVTVVSLKHKV